MSPTIGLPKGPILCFHIPQGYSYSLSSLQLSLGVENYYFVLSLMSLHVALKPEGRSTEVVTEWAGFGNR